MRIIRHSIPVDDAAHTVRIPVGRDAVLHVACRRTEEVDIWVMDNDVIPMRNATFVVVGTGHYFDPTTRWVGTCVAPSGLLVWHLMELMT